MSDVAELLRSHGHRSTRPREAVWSVLDRDGAHLTAEEIARRVADDDPTVNLASIYRSLALFRDLGLARETRLGDEDASRWELAHPDEHFHVVCDACGRVDHHVGTLVASIVEHLSGDHGFVPERVELVVHGRCRACAAGDPTDPAPAPAGPATGVPRRHGHPRAADDGPSR